MKIIEVVVSPRGETTIQTKGYSGSECEQASKEFEQSLGAKISDRKTPEFYATSSNQNEVKA